ncbi:YbbR-like domain-containing protein [Desulfovibrio sp. PG-178-WT-4]|uniref:YbbR-like domain-containing protein n=1 Tax=Desulfovibrio porci TaxID=2605782 RepID=A0A6L5XI23_9BACT|nr:CdaR family protein [Desulfovibrio porci]MDY3809760.1 CdaR family protein [Desulfovibrio porci]MSS26758.1 YbbR-like domain-containing protein [Desulfovibrio porci]
MKSSENNGGLRRAPHLFSLLVAVLAAVAMWYVVSVRDRLEAQVEVNIDYYGIPPNLVVTDGLISKITVRLRGPETLLRSIPQQRLTQAVDLSDIKKGVTIVPLGGDNLGPNFRAFELVDIQPPRIVIKADTLLERSVPLRTIVDSPLRGGALTVENVSVSPATVVLRGPEDVVSDISSVPLTIMLDPKAAGTTVHQTIALDTPSLVTATPSSVRVQYTITSGRTVVSRRCKVELAGENRRQYTVEPEEVTVLVEVPEALAKSARYLGQLEVSVTPPSLEPGQSEKAELRFRLPEGMTLLNPATEEVTVFRKKK